MARSNAVGASNLYKGSSDLYCLNPEADGMLIDQQITRQQLGSLAGVSDDVLAFWIKNGLLVAASGGEGKGSHRRFDGYQVSIAAILAELRTFGINLAGLRSFAERLQAATALGKSAECNPMAFYDAQELRGKIAAFERGEEVLIGEPPTVIEDRGEIRAGSLDDIYEYLKAWPGRLNDTFENILAFAKRITPEDIRLLNLFLDVHGDAFGRLYRGRLMAQGDASWLAVRQADESWLILNAPDPDTAITVGEDEYCSGIYLLPTRIVRRAWKGRLTPTIIPEMLPSEDERIFDEGMDERLKRANRKHSVGISKRILAAAEKSE